MIACECTEHPCRPSPAQTERYAVLGGAQLCAACYTLGHMANPDPVLRAYEDAGRRAAMRP